MAVTHQGTSARANGTTTLAITLSGAGGNRVALAGRTVKPETATAVDETGWTALLNTTGGTGTTGVDVGQTRIKIDSKIVVAGEANPTFDQGSTPNAVVGAASIYSCAPGASILVTVPTSGNDSTAGVGRSATSGSTSLAVGDVIWVYVSSNSDFNTGAWTGPTISVSAGTVGSTTTRLAAGGSSTGNDVGDAIYEATVATAGTGTITFATNADGQSNSGPVGFVVLREIPGPVYPVMPPKAAV